MDSESPSFQSRNVTSTFSLRDVAIIAMAAFAAAGPFYAYNTRMTVIETKIERLEKRQEVLNERQSAITLEDTKLRSDIQHLDQEVKRLRTEKEGPLPK